MPDFKVTRYKLRTGDFGRSPETPFSAVFLSDLHNVSYGEQNSGLLAEIRNQNPAVVFISGDMLTGGAEPEMDAAMALMGELTKKYPVYYGNGNHEQRMKAYPERYGDAYERYSSAIKSYGVHLLENGCERLELQRLPMTVWGYELPMEYYRRGRRMELLPMQMEDTLGTPEKNTLNILLAHNPLYFDTYAAWGADLTLSGHLHGGIVRLPFFGGLVSPQMRLFPRYDKGMFSKGEKKLITSAGLGSHTVKLRINNPPELVVIDFV